MIGVTRLLAPFALVAWWGLSSGVAWAHTLSESISSWTITGNLVRVQFIVPDLEARRLSEDGKEVPSGAAIGHYLSQHVGASASGLACEPTGVPRVLASTPGFSRHEFEFRCAGSGDVRVHSSAFYERVPTHTNFARIEDDAGNFSEQLLTRDRQEIEVAGDRGTSPLRDASLLTFVRMGMMHIFTGVDHMAFMLGLVLISRRVRDLLFVVTGFTIGHSLTLALAVTGILRPDAQYIDALVALTIALIGAENIGDATRRPLPLALGFGGLLMFMALGKGMGLGIELPLSLLIGGGIFAASYLMLTGKMGDAGRVRLLVTLVFGLIHGFGFAANFLELRLPAERLAGLLLGFNVGVEIGQVAVVLGAVLVTRLLLRWRPSLARPVFSELAAASLVSLGIYWFVGRTVSLEP